MIHKYYSGRRVWGAYRRFGVELSDNVAQLRIMVEGGLADNVSSICVISREDLDLPTPGRMASLWHSLSKAIRARSGASISARWMIQNVAETHAETRLVQERHPWPIGVHHAPQLSAFLSSPHGRAASTVEQRRNTLLCCCIAPLA